MFKSSHVVLFIRTRLRILSDLNVKACFRSNQLNRVSVFGQVCSSSCRQRSFKELFVFVPSLKSRRKKISSPVCEFVCFRSNKRRILGQQNGRFSRRLQSRASRPLWVCVCAGRWPSAYPQIIVTGSRRRFVSPFCHRHTVLNSEFACAYQLHNLIVSSQCKLNYCHELSRSMNCVV